MEDRPFVVSVPRSCHRQFSIVLGRNPGYERNEYRLGKPGQNCCARVRSPGRTYGDRYEISNVRSERLHETSKRTTANCYTDCGGKADLGALVSIGIRAPRHSKKPPSRRLALRPAGRRISIAS